MQLGNNLYIDIEIPELNIKNFLIFSDIMDFRMVETAGASLPYIYMKVLVRDEKIKNSIQQNNKIKVTVGNTSTEADSFIIELVNVINPKDPSDTGWCVEFAGFIGSQSYMQEVRTKAYWGNSLFVVNDIMGEYIGKKGKVTASLEEAVKGDADSAISKSLKEYLGNSDLKEVSDSGTVSASSEVGNALNKYMNNKNTAEILNYVTSDFGTTNENQVVWRQCNTTACYFVADTLLHSDLRPSFPVFSFDRYLNFYIRDLSKMVKEGPTHTFTPAVPQKTDEIRYYNSFNVDSFKPVYNLYSGFNKITEIYDAVSGIPQNVISPNEPILAATTEAEKTDIGNTCSMNNIQSSNVHDNYAIAFAHNTNILVALSSMIGVLELRDRYYKELHPTELITVNPYDTDDPTLGGRYLIDTIVTVANFSTGGFNTYVYVTRDNKNNVENYVPRTEGLGQKWMRVRRDSLDLIATAVAAYRSVYATAMRIIDGRFLQGVFSYLSAVKNAALRSFRIAGVNIDFNSSENLLTSLIAEGNSLLNLFFEMIFPTDVATALRDYVIRERTPVGAVSNYIDMYVPFEIQGIITEIVDSLFNVEKSLNSIAQDNGISIAAQGGNVTVSDTSEISYVAEGQQRVDNIISGFERNTTGLEVPFPIIELTESQALFPEDELKDYVADETIAKLDELGYLGNDDALKADFKDILLGNKPIDFNVINKINANAGDTFAYRYWGTYNSPEELTGFMIKKSFKDKYRTIPCTKLISAVRNAKIFFACPEAETDLKFYINSKRVILPSFDLDMGFVDIYGKPVLYTVYYTEEGYNSNSVLFEVKQGGMV